MLENKSNPTAVRILTLLIVLYGIAAMIYEIYETTTSRGIAGFIMAREIDWFGGASFAISYCLALVVVTVPPFILAFVLGVTVLPSLGEALSGLFVSKPKQAGVAGTTPVKAAPSDMTWSLIGKTIGVMFGLTGAVAAILYFLNVREQSLGVYKLNLDSPQVTLPERIGFIQVTGHAVGQLGLTYHDQHNVSLVVPVTSGSWSVEKPVHVFIHYQQPGSSASQLTPPSEFRGPGVAVFGGEMEGKLPVFVERAYAGKGLKIDPGYKVIGWQRLSPGEVPRSESHVVALGVGGLISVSLSLIMILLKLKGRKKTVAGYDLSR